MCSFDVKRLTVYGNSYSESHHLRLPDILRSSLIAGLSKKWTVWKHTNIWFGWESHRSDESCKAYICVKRLENLRTASTWRNGFLDILFSWVPRNCSNIQYINSTFHSVISSLVSVLQRPNKKAVSRSEVYGYCSAGAASWLSISGNGLRSACRS